MSIWCSWPSVGTDDMDPDEPTPRGGHVLTYADGYSNHYPDHSGDYELPANVGICHAAPWCVTGHDQNGDHWTCSACGVGHDYGDAVGDFVRLTIAANVGLSFWGDPEDRPKRSPVYAAVVMDEAAARQLAADLLAWADRPKVTPAPATHDLPEKRED